MKRVLWSMIAGLVLLTATAMAGPTIAVDTESYDWGTVLEGYSVTHTFIIQNVGDEDLIISRVRVSCGCTGTRLATDQLAPGESVELAVTFNSTGFSGNVSKTVSVFSNDEARKRPDGQDGALSLYMRGIVQRGQYYHTSVTDMNYLFYTLIDLRDEAAFATGHLMGAVNVQPEALADWAGALPLDTLIVLIDQAGEAAPEAAQTLAAAGYAQTRFVNGGMSWWVNVYGTDQLLSVNNPLSSPSASSTSSSLALDIADMKYLFYALIDLRSPEAFAASHLAGAINIPFAELADWLELLPKGDPIFLIDEDGTDSDAAVQVLLNDGFNEARSLLGGMKEWANQFEDRFILSQ